MKLIFLDSGPLGLIVNPRSSPHANACRQWARELAVVGARIFLPEICDYEIRRKLLHLRATASLARLDLVKAQLEFAPITSAVMTTAAELWADARRAGRPTASPEALDGDCILAATALLAADSEGSDGVIVATDNVGHLSQFVDARPWDQITIQPPPKTE